MDEHPGDTLGKRFLTFWGVVIAILLFGLGIRVVKWALGPSEGEPLDAGASAARTERRAKVDQEQMTEYNTFSKDDAKGTVRMPPDALLGYAASVLSKDAEAKTNAPTGAPAVPSSDGSPAPAPTPAPTTPAAVAPAAPTGNPN